MTELDVLSITQLNTCAFRVKTFDYFYLEQIRKALPPNDPPLPKSEPTFNPKLPSSKLKTRLKVPSRINQFIPLDGPYFSYLYLTGARGFSEITASR